MTPGDMLDLPGSPSDLGHWPRLSCPITKSIAARRITFEDREDYRLALERIQNPEGEPVTLEDVIARLGLDDSI